MHCSEKHRTSSSSDSEGNMCELRQLSFSASWLSGMNWKSSSLWNIQYLTQSWHLTLVYNISSDDLTIFLAAASSTHTHTHILAHSYLAQNIVHRQKKSATIFLIRQLHAASISCHDFDTLFALLARSSAIYASFTCFSLAFDDVNRRALVLAVTC